MFYILNICYTVYCSFITVIGKIYAPCILLLLHQCCQKTDNANKKKKIVLQRSTAAKIALFVKYSVSRFYTDRLLAFNSDLSQCSGAAGRDSCEENGSGFQ